MDGEIINVCRDGKYEFVTSLDEQNHGTALKQREEIQLTRKPEKKSKTNCTHHSLTPSCLEIFSCQKTSSTSEPTKHPITILEFFNFDRTSFDFCHSLLLYFWVLKYS